MKKFCVRISVLLRALFLDLDLERSAELAKELAKMEQDRPKALAKSEAAKEAYWVKLEEMRKARALGYGPSKMQEIQRELWAAEAAVSGPLNEESEKWSRLSGEIELAGRPLRNEIEAQVQKYIEQVMQFRVTREGHHSETWGTVSMVEIERNDAAIERVVKMLVDFKREIHSAIRLSLGDLLKRVERFESEINVIDIFQFDVEKIRKDVSQMRF